MKTSFFRPALLVGTGLILSSTLVVSAIAGPGPQYWQNSGKAADGADQANVTATGVCPGSKLVPVTVTNPAWANGKGPLVETQVGTKRVCSVCPVTGVTTVGWSNGRGPATKGETAATGAQHDCATGCFAGKS